MCAGGGGGGVGWGGGDDKGKKCLPKGPGKQSDRCDDVKLHVVRQVPTPTETLKSNCGTSSS